MRDLTCRECAYFWTEDDDEYPSCHYESLGSWDPAPCEQPDDDDKCSGDCDPCKYAYYETDHGYAYEESKLHCSRVEQLIDTIASTYIKVREENK